MHAHDGSVSKTQDNKSRSDQSGCHAVSRPTPTSLGDKSAGKYEASSNKRQKGNIKGTTVHGSDSGLTRFYLEDFEEEVWAPACGFAAGFDTSLGLVGADEIESEATDDCHVFGAVATPVSRQVVFEGHVEQPVKALDGPVAAGPGGDPLDVEGHRTDVFTCVEGPPVGKFVATS